MVIAWLDSSFAITNKGYLSYMNSINEHALTAKNKTVFVNRTITKPKPLINLHYLDMLQHYDLAMDLEFGFKRNCNKYYLH